jgi:nitrogen fixation NifU-like protein
MSDLKDLYQEVILDHNKHPRNHHELPTPSGQAEGFNPLCGDRVQIYLNVDGDKVADVSFLGSGCAIATASASMLTEIVKGMKVAEARELCEQFFDVMTSKEEQPQKWESLGKLMVFEGVKKYPMRVKCATLAWHTLVSALERSRATSQPPPHPVITAIRA